MRTTIRAGLGVLLLGLGLAGCAGVQEAPTVAALQQECERSGGIWRTAGAYCERSAGGGGY